MVVVAFLNPCALLCDDCILIAQFSRPNNHPLRISGLFRDSDGPFLSVSNPSRRLSIVLLLFLFFHHPIGEGLITTRPCALGEAHFRSTFPARFGHVSISVVDPAAWRSLPYQPFAMRRTSARAFLCFPPAARLARFREIGCVSD